MKIRSFPWLSAGLGVVLVALYSVPYSASAVAQPQPEWRNLSCNAQQTAGLHDYPGEPESYEATVFQQSRFRVELNPVFERHLDAKNRQDLHLTLYSDRLVTELACRYVLAGPQGRGYSCVNSPPSEMLLLNYDNLRFTRTSIGGWTFVAGEEARGGDSIYVEYGRCQATDDADETGAVQNNE